MSEAKHTTLPWKYDNNGIVEGKDDLVCDCDISLKTSFIANAEFICLACNNHDALVDLLRQIKTVTTSDYNEYAKSYNYEKFLDIREKTVKLIAQIEKESK